MNFTILSYNIELNLNQVKLKESSTLIQTNYKNIELVLNFFSGIQVAVKSSTLFFWNKKLFCIKKEVFLQTAADGERV